MNSLSTQVDSQTKPRRKDTMFRQTARRLLKNKSAVFGMILFAVILIVCVFAPVFAPYGPNDLDLANINATPSLAHPCGTDSLGRDCLSRLIYGGRYSLALGFSGSIVGIVGGAVGGCAAGYFGGKVETVIMRACDILSAIPGQLLTILLSVTLGSSFFSTALALSIGGIPIQIRLLRANVLSAKGEQYVEAAQAYNCSSSRIMFRHLLPNTISPLLINFTMNIGGTIMGAAGLSFIGLGIQPPTPEWGAMLSSGRAYIRQYPHLIVFPGLIIMITVFAINLFGDGLRDALDPKMKD